MNIRKLLLISAAILGFVGQAAAQTPDQVTVARVTGTVTAQLPDGSTVDVKAGSQLPQGATIKTGDKSEVFLVSHGDTTSTIVANSEVSIAEVSTTGSGGSVTKQTTTLDLKSGNIVAKLNPAKKAVNNYSVRTPKGVAAARGTVFTVSYKGGTYSIAVVNGQVTVTPPAGTRVSGQVAFTLDAGGENLFYTTPGGQERKGNLSAEANDTRGNQEIRELLAIAVTTVAVAAQNNIGGTTAQEAAAIAQTILTAIPSAAEQVGALMNQSGVSSGAVADAVRAAVPAAAQSAFDSGASTGTFTPSSQTTTTTTPSAPVTTPQPIEPSTISRSGE